jgi:nucleoside-diphosphate-sugar epimerase
VDTLLFAVGYDRAAGIDQWLVYVEGLVNVLGAIPAVRDRVIYISSTGVYAQGDDAWVDEQSPCAPCREGGRCCLAAEQRLQAHRWGDRAVILRLAGIYGPGRVPYLDRLRQGEPLPVVTDGYLNLIHVDDAMRVVLAAEHGPVPELFVVSDGNPVLRGDYYRAVGNRLGIEPQFTLPVADSPQAARAAASKRIRNDHLRRTLEVEFQYGDYRAGLTAILERAR